MGRGQQAAASPERLLLQLVQAWYILMLPELEELLPLFCCPPWRCPLAMPCMLCSLLPTCLPCPTPEALLPPHISASSPHLGLHACMPLLVPMTSFSQRQCLFRTPEPSSCFTFCPAPHASDSPGRSPWELCVGGEGGVSGRVCWLLHSSCRPVVMVTGSEGPTATADAVGVRWGEGQGCRPVVQACCLECWVPWP